MTILSWTVNGECHETITVDHGETLELAAFWQWHNSGMHCSGCVEQLYFGVANTGGLECLWSKNPDETGFYQKTYGPFIGGPDGSTYEIHAASSLKYYCIPPQTGHRLVKVHVRPGTAPLCKDIYPAYCLTWKEWGLCDSSFWLDGWMSTYCKATCGLC